MRPYRILTLLAIVSCMMFWGRIASAQDITVTEGTPVSVVAYSGYGAPQYYSCGPNFAQNCDGGTAYPNGNIQWTIDGGSVGSSYDTVLQTTYDCMYYGDDFSYPTTCYAYRDESGYSGTLPSGWHTITAFIPSYQDPYAAFSTSWSVYVVPKVTPALSVSCAPNPITYGSQNTNCTAWQSGGTGSLTWTINGNPWTTTGINGSAGGFAGWNAGSYTIGVSYSGDSGFNPVSSSTVLTIAKTTPNVTVSLSPSTVTYGQSFTASVHVDCNSACGNVEYRLDGQYWGTVPLDGNGNFSAANNSGAVGAHLIEIIYQGDGNRNAASGSAVLTTMKLTPSLSVACSPSSLFYGTQETTCIASVSATGGTVAFYSPTTLSGQWWNGSAGSWYPQNGGNVASAPLAITHDGVLNYNIANSGAPSGWAGAQVGGPGGLNHDYYYVRWTGTFLSAIGGNYTIGVNSDDGANIYVNGAMLVNNLGAGQGAIGDLSLMQSGNINLAAGATNTIVVEFQQGNGDAGIQLLWIPPGASSTSLLGWTVTPVDGGGHASVTGAMFVGGTSSVKAVYSGDATHTGATATTTVNAVARTVTEIFSGVNPSNQGQTITFSGLVHTGGVAPSGNVSVFDGGASIGSGGITLKAATNLVRNSQKIGAPNWGGYCGPMSNVTMSTSDIAAPDGSNTATRFITPASPGCGTGPSQGAIDFVGGLTVGQPYTASIWMRAAVNGTNVIFGLDDCHNQQFTLDTTWRRYTYTAASYSNPCNPDRGLEFLSWDQSATYYVWGAQLEQTQTAGPYIMTDFSARSGYGGVATVTNTSLLQGSHSITATYGGDSQTVASSSVSLTQTVLPPPGYPYLAGATPASGHVGIIISINGSNFGVSQGSNSVTFNGVTGTVTSWSDTSISVQVPNGAGTGNVVVHVNGNDSNGIPFTVTQIPPNIQFSCTSPAAAGTGTVCTVQMGTGVTGNVVLSVGGNQVSSGALNASGQFISSNILTSYAPGTYQVQAHYGGNVNYLQADASFTVSITIAHGTLLYKFSDINYASNSNILGYTERLSGVDQVWSDIGYDALNRLIATKRSPGAGSPEYMCWTYDSFGNRTLQAISDKSMNQQCQAASGASIYTPSVAYYTTTGMQGSQDNGQNRLTGLNATIMQYDEAGYLGWEGLKHYLYDAEGHLCAVEIPGSPPIRYQYIYDAAGNRVAKRAVTTFNCELDNPSAGQIQAIYLASSDGQHVTEVDGSGNWVHSNVYAGRELIATYSNDNGGTTPATGALSFALKDWLGSKKVEVGYDGHQENVWMYQPFGEISNASSSGGTDNGFTGKNRDQESGLDNFGARYYGSGMGRFTSPDPSGLYFANPNNPQSMNLYSYALNNPLKNKDRNGLYCYYGDTGGGAQNDADLQDSSQFDYHSSQGECTKEDENGNKGQWINDDATHQDSNGQWVDNDNRPEDYTINVQAGGAQVSAGNPQATSKVDQGSNAVITGSAWIPIPQLPVLGISIPFTYVPNTGLTCVGIGGGFGGRTPGVNVGFGTVTTPGNGALNASYTDEELENVAGGWSASVTGQATPFLGVQRSENGSGAITGNSYGSVGVSWSVSYSWCGHL